VTRWVNGMHMFISYSAVVDFHRRSRRRESCSRTYRTVDGVQRTMLNRGVQAGGITQDDTQTAHNTNHCWAAARRHCTCRLSCMCGSRCRRRYSRTYPHNRPTDSRVDTLRTYIVYILPLFSYTHLCCRCRCIGSRICTAMDSLPIRRWTGTAPHPNTLSTKWHSLCTHLTATPAAHSPLVCNAHAISKTPITRMCSILCDRTVYTFNTDFRTCVRLCVRESSPVVCTRTLSAHTTRPYHQFAQ